MLEELKQWVREGQGNRSIQIIIGECGNPYELKIWTYDYKLSKGQYINGSVSEIDIYKEVELEEKAEYERLKKKFEGGK